MEQEYIYAVARIKARELSLLTQQDLDRLMACKTPAECFRALADKGWGAGGETSAEAIFAAEEEKTWALMHELLPDLTPFSVLLYPIDFNNMKAAVKCTVTNAEPHNVFMSGGTMEPEKMQQAVRENDFSLLPDFTLIFRPSHGGSCHSGFCGSDVGGLTAAGTAADSHGFPFSTVCQHSDALYHSRCKVN